MKVDPRFLKEEGTEVYTGNELLVKGLLETDGGTHLWTGYPGSPVSGFFDCVEAIQESCEYAGQFGIILALENHGGITATPELKETLRQHVAKEIGSLARPDDVRFAAGLPKTRSGKIMRRILKEIAAGGTVKGDTTTLEDFSVVAALQHDE